MATGRHVRGTRPAYRLRWRELRALAVLAALLVLPAAAVAASAQQSVAAAGAHASPAPAAASTDIRPTAAQPAPAPTAPPATAAATPPGTAASKLKTDKPNDAAAAAPADEPGISGELLPQRLSLVRMYLDADRVVKAVMIGLAFASLVSWTVFLAKLLELRAARAGARRGLRILFGANSFAQAHDQLHDAKISVALMVQAAAEEIRLSASARGDGLKERIASQLDRLELSNSRKTSRGIGVLATIGSTAVFVGLFGTVWGIMNSFIGISNAHTTNLAVVAPGIAQALLATAMGLIAAIPAVVIYNVLTRQTLAYRALLGDASAQIVRLISRDLDRARLPLAQAAE